MFITIVFCLLCIAFLLSLRSLHAELKKNIKTHEVAASLSKGRVLFIAESSEKKTDERREQPSAIVQAPIVKEQHMEQPMIPADLPKDTSLDRIRDELSQLNNPVEKKE